MIFKNNRKTIGVVLMTNNYFAIIYFLNFVNITPSVL